MFIDADNIAPIEPLSKPATESAIPALTAYDDESTVPITLSA